jgi:hypothetical protein
MMNDEARLKRLFASALSAGERVCRQGLGSLSVAGDEREFRFFRFGLDLIEAGLDLEAAMEILEILLNSSGAEFRQSPLNQLALEAVRAIALGESPRELHRRTSAAVGRELGSAAPPPGPGPARQDIAESGHLHFVGDIDAGMGPIETERSVWIEGDVGDGVSIRTPGYVGIAGHVGAANIEAGGSIQVEGCVQGKGRGRLRCGGDIEVVALERASAEAGGDVRAAAGIRHAEVRSGGRVECSGLAGAILGGSVLAQFSINAARIGGRFCGKTEVALSGPGPDAGVRFPGAAATDSTVSVRERLYPGVIVRIGTGSFATRSEFAGVTMRAEGFMVRLDPCAKTGPGPAGG